MGEGLSKKLENSFRNQCIFFIVTMSVLIFSYLLLREQIYKQFGIVEDDYIWVYQVDAIALQDDKLIIEGWAFEQWKNAEENAYEIIMYDLNTGKGLYPDMQYSKREDVNNYFLCEYSYLESGFRASVSVDKLDLEEGMYEILLRPAGEHNAYSTGVYYFDGKKVSVNPQEHIPLKTEGTDLEIIIKEGCLLLYLPDIGVYVYQYEDSLYWITDVNYNFAAEGTTMSYRLSTSQLENLPESDIKSNRDWAYLDFDFSQEEILDWNTGQYRVAMCKIPSSFPITKIWTGELDTRDYNWKWLSHFRPNYIFE